jgi:hypothetical protein
MRIRVRYYGTRRKGEHLQRFGYWQPCLARRNKRTGAIEPTLMAKLGFHHVACGPDGPEAWAIAESWNRKWDEAYKAHATIAASTAVAASSAVDDRQQTLRHSPAPPS